MSDLCVRLGGSMITHLVSWSDHVGGYVRCGVDFSWRPNDFHTNARNIARAVDGADCDCMSCLARPR